MWLFAGTSQERSKYERAAHSYGKENGPQTYEKMPEITPKSSANHSSRETRFCTYQIGNAPRVGIKGCEALGILL